MFDFAFVLCDRTVSNACVYTHTVYVSSSPIWYTICVCVGFEHLLDLFLYLQFSFSLYLL